jgi:histidinol dehydrogenase
MMRRLSTHSESFDQELNDLLSFSEDDQTAIEKTVISILKEVRIEGDDAVIRHTNQFDRLTARTIADLQITADQLNEARKQLPLEQLEALENAAMRVRSYHERQMRESGCKSWEYTEPDGTVLGQQIGPLDRVGIYVPGGKAAYPSSVLMNAIPAKVAGVGELVMVVPTPDGLHNPLVLAAAAIAGVDRVFTIGGAQAIGALAYGTKSIPAVDKIVGPGNAFVACAKRRVFGTVGIDMIAGPSEILVLCDGKTHQTGSLWISFRRLSMMSLPSRYCCARMPNI